MGTFCGSRWGGCLGGSPLDLLQMVAQELRHREGTHTLGAEDLGHLLVGREELLVLRVLEVVFLQIGPQVLHALGPGSLLHANDGRQLWAHLHGCSKSTSLGHLDSFLKIFSTSLATSSNGRSVTN